MVDTVLHEGELWLEFHRVVNMSSGELARWLRTHSVSSNDANLPNQAGTPTGQEVLRMLSKRRTDLTRDDLQVMRSVVRQVHVERRGNRAAVADRADWRHHLMSLGHDPLKPA
ncbi:MAG: DUF3140 domain-containing protein [Pseudonocardiaceae bacterium]